MPYPKDKTNCVFCGIPTRRLKKSYVVIKLQHSTVISYVHNDCLRRIMLPGGYRFLVGKR